LELLRASFVLEKRRLPEVAPRLAEGCKDKVPGELGDRTIENH